MRPTRPTGSRRRGRAASSSGEIASIPAARRHSTPSAHARRWRSRPSAFGPQSASSALPRLFRSLAYFHRMMSGRATDSNDDSPNASRDRLRTRVDPVGEPTEVEDPGHGPGVGLDHARFEVQRGADDAHAVDAVEEAERGAFVGDAVLHAHHGNRRGCARRQRAERLAGVLALHREQHHVVGAEVDARRVGDDRDGERHGVGATVGGGVGRHQAQPTVTDRVVVVTASDQHHVVALLRQPATHHSADRAGAVHDESHRRSLAHRKVPERTWEGNARLSPEPRRAGAGTTRGGTMVPALGKGRFTGRGCVSWGASFLPGLRPTPLSRAEVRVPTATGENRARSRPASLSGWWAA